MCNLDHGKTWAESLCCEKVRSSEKGERNGCRVMNANASKTHHRMIICVKQDC